MPRISPTEMVISGLWRKQVIRQLGLLVLPGNFLTQVRRIRCIIIMALRGWHQGAEGVMCPTPARVLQDLLIRVPLAGGATAWAGLALTTASPIFVRQVVVAAA